MIDKQILLDKLIKYQSSDNALEYINEDETEYLISLIRTDIMMDEFMKLHPHNLNRDKVGIV